MLNSGARVGVYEIVSPLGAGGMGEVYRARDTKLGRDVAIKVLPGAFAGDPERLARFTREAQTLASLNHPNIATIYGVEGHAIVMELLDGATLREETSGTPLPTRKAIDWGIQIAHGLAAAHEKGIVHRDLKPENVFVTRDGRLKLLDFGIARAQPLESAGATMTSLGAPQPTADGVVLGTVGYMSPEQVRGREIDARSDIFSLGAVLYEMLSGRRPFAADSPVETMHAILSADPPAFEDGSRGVPPALDRIVRRCLEKRPADRFHSAHDLALALEAVSGASTQTLTAVPRGTSVRRWALAAAALAIGVAGTGAAAWRMGTGSAIPLPTFQRLTFQRGTIGGARFIPNSTDVVYSAAWQGSAPELFTVRAQRPESLSVGAKDASLFAVSSSQDLALMLAPHLATGHWSGTLATAPIGGGGARQIATRIIAADFAPDGSLIYADWDGEHAHIRTASGRVIHEESSMIIALRAAPAGGNIAFVTYEPATRPLHIIDADGRSRGAAGGDVTGLAWTSDGTEVLFSEPSVSGETTISAARPGGRRRLLWRGAGTVVLDDVSSTGVMLASFVDSTSSVLVQQGASAAAADMGWLDDSMAADVSPSGDALLMNARFGNVGAYYIRKLDGSPPVKLGDGTAEAWSPDGQQILAQTGTTTTVLTSVGPGTPRTIAHPDTTSFFGWYLPDGRILLNGQRQTTTWRFFLLDPEGQIRPVGPDGLDHWVGQHVPSDDGTLLAAYASGHNDAANPIVIPLAGGQAVSTAGFKRDEVVVRFTPDNQHLLVYDRDRLPVRVYALDYRTGARSLWREFMPGDPTGIRGVKSIVMSPGGGVVAYNYARELSTLYLINGLR